jgi:hypothetical protein
VPKERHPTENATALLSQMLLEQAITNFVSNFEAVRRRGVLPEVLVWMREVNEFSCARMTKQIRDELEPLLGVVKVTVEPDPWIPKTQPPAKPPEAKEA